MNMSRRLIRRRGIEVTAAAAVAALVVAGCGSGSSTGSSTASSSGSAAASGAAASTAQGGASGGKLTTVTITTAATSASQALPYLAEEAGIFKANGINAKVTTAGNAVVVAGISTGRLNMAVFGSPGPEVAALEGAPVKWLMQWLQAANEQLIVGPGISNACQLKGKPVGITTVGSLSELFLLVGLQTCHLTLHDVKVVPLQTVPAYTAAFASGEVDAIAEGPPSSTAARDSRKGSSFAINFLGKLNWPTAGIIGYMPWVTSHQAVATAVVKSLLQAEQLYESNPTAAKKAINAINGKTLTPAQATAAYNSAKGLFTLNPVASTKLETYVLKELKLLGPPYSKIAAPSKASTLFDNSFVVAAEKELKLPSGSSSAGAS